MNFQSHATTRTARLSVHFYAGFLLLLMVFSTSSYALSNPDTALDDYVTAPDPSYTYQLLSSTPGMGVTTHLYAMTSQQWRSAVEVDRTLWTHTLAIIVPDQVAYQTAMLLAGSGSNSGNMDIPAEELMLASQVAFASNSIVAVLGQSLNQPLLFADQSTALYEDALVAYSWDKTLATGDYAWPVYLPMVKAIVRALDTVQTEAPVLSGQSLNGFVVSGFSKRGGATWLSAVVDARITAIAPGVYDALNMALNFEHHYQAYGFYSSALQPYVDLDLIRRIRTPEAHALLKVIDPYSYLNRLTLPKFLLNSSGDQFFLPDSAQFYFGDLGGETTMRYVPNTDHTLSDNNGFDNALFSLTSWYMAQLSATPRPAISWQLSNGTLTVNAAPAPLSASLWQATNSNARDFRKQTIGASWTESPLSGNGSYQVSMPAPPSGWSAYFVELHYADINGVPQTYSSRIFVTPDTLPFVLDDVINNPRDLSYWTRQVKAAMSRQSVAKKLQPYFPIPLFDVIVTDIAAANTILQDNSNDPSVVAQQECLATRLNVASAEIGWYSDLDPGPNVTPFWGTWTSAHDAYLAANPTLSTQLCEAVNAL